MIKKIYPNEFDLYNMSLKRTVPVVSSQKIDYKGVVVNKPWGYEYLMFENSHVAIWILFLKYQAKTSMHCHPKKKTSLLVLDGSVKTSSLDSIFELKSSEGIIIESGVFHSTAATSHDGVFLMEVETPVDKSDLVRLKDEYGRESLGYESGESITSKLEDYEHCHFYEEIEESEEVRRLLKKKIMRIRHSKNFKELYNESSNNQEIICPLNYKVVNSKGKVFLEVGDIVEVKDLQKKDGLFSVPESGLLSLIIS